MDFVLRLYAAPIALTIWAVLWTAGIRGDLVIGLALLVVAVAHVVAERERAVRRRERR